MLGPYRTPGFAQIRQLRNRASPGLPLPDLSTLLGKYLRAFTNAGIFGMVIISVLAIFLIAAIICPTPDPIGMCLFATPMLVLYMIGVGVAFLVHPARRKAREAEKPA